MNFPKDYKYSKEHTQLKLSGNDEALIGITEFAQSELGEIVYVDIPSVGKPKDNNPKGCYVMLTVNQNSSITSKDSITVDFIRFDYDVEKAAKAVEDSPLPNEYAEMLRKGF